MYLFLNQKEMLLIKKRFQNRLSAKNYRFYKSQNGNKRKNDISFSFNKDDINKKKEISITDISLSGDKSLTLGEILFSNSNPTTTKSVEIDYSDLHNTSFSIEMLVGDTGTGKTYKAITENENFIIAVPTRQLAYELFIDYRKINSIATGEVHISPDQAKNAVVVYENLNEQVIDKFSTLIVDEAHFINDDERGGYLIKNIIYALSHNKKVVMATATDTISDDVKNLLHINTTFLKPFKRVEKIEIDNDLKVKELAKQGKSVLVFTKYRPDEYDVENYADRFGIKLSKADYISADIPTSERVSKQIMFRKGEIQLMVSSNVLAQGVNFPADIVVIEYNEWDSWEIINQKIGRAGRPQFTDKAYYLLQYMPEKNQKTGTINQVTENIIMFYRGIYIKDWNFKKHEVPYDITEYRGFKYSRRFLEKLEQKNLINNNEQSALNFLRQEEEKLIDIIKA